MAETTPEPQQETVDVVIETEEQQRLKYLEFVQVTVLQTVMCVSKVYDYARSNSGPLKPGVESVEGTFKTVVGPVYDKFHDVPVDVLKFVDRKVDESVNKFDSRVPPFVKQASTQAFSAAQKAPAAARSVASEVKITGVVGTASGLAKTVYTKCEPTAKQLYSKYEPTAKQLYSKYEPVAEQYAVSAWQSLNQLPLFPHVAHVVVPTATYCSEKYNETVQLAAEKGYKVSSYLPLVPTAKIAKVFSAEDTPAQAAH